MKYFLSILSVLSLFLLTSCKASEEAVEVVEELEVPEVVEVVEVVDIDKVREGVEELDTADPVSIDLSLITSEPPINEYVSMVLNDDTDAYVIDEPTGYVPFSYGLNKPAADVAPDGVTVGPIHVYISNNIENAQLYDDYTFYLKVEGPDDCWGDIIDGTIEESECPNIITWYGPFDGPIFGMMQ